MLAFLLFFMSRLPELLLLKFTTNLNIPQYQPRVGSLYPNWYEGTPLPQDIPLGTN